MDGAHFCLQAEPRFVVGTYHGAIYGLQMLSATELQDDEDERMAAEAAADETESKEPQQAPRTMKTVFATDAHVGSVKSVAASASGKFLVSGGVDEIIR